MLKAAFVICLALFVFAPIVAQAQDGDESAPIVLVQPSSVTVKEGDVFNVSVVIENLAVNHGMVGVEFNLTWNNAILNSLGINEVLYHTITPQDEWDNIWQIRLTVNNTGGYAWYACLWMDTNRAIAGGYCPVNGISGNHTLAIVTMKAVAAGSITFHFSCVKVCDMNAQSLLNIDENGYQPPDNGNSGIEFVKLVTRETGIDNSTLEMLRDYVEPFPILVNATLLTARTLGDTCAAEQLTVINSTFEFGHIYVEFMNEGSSDITIIRHEISPYDSSWFYGNKENVTPSGSPVNIAPNATEIVDFECSWVPGRPYGGAIYFSDHSAFTCRIGTSPTSISGVLLYSMNVNFYRLNGSKIDVDIGNCGTLDGTVAEFYVLGSDGIVESMILTPVTVQAGGRSRIPLNYNWTPDETYQFKAICDSGQAISWTWQAPLWKQDDNRDPVIVRFESENMTVEKDEIFTVDVVIENIPENHGCAGIQFDVTWDSGVLLALNMTEVMFHSVTPPEEHDNIWVLVHKVNNTGGYVSYAYTWQDGGRARDDGYSPIFGNHTLASITFKALDTGSATLHFSQVLMGDLDAEPMVHSVDEPQAYGRVWTSLLNYVLVDCKVNVASANSPDEVSYFDASKDKSDTGLGSKAPVDEPSNTPQTFSYVGRMIALAAVAVAVVPTSIFAHQRRRKNSVRF